MNSHILNVHRLSQIEQARRNVINEGLPASPWLPDWISQSWQRCLQQGMQPHFEVGFAPPLSQAQIEGTLDHNHDFVQAARPELERLSRANAGTSFLR